MKGVCICSNRQARRPYYVENMDVRLYSMEELAYFLYHNSYLADKEMVGEKLCQWPAKEAGQQDLAERLRKGIKAGLPIQNLILAILRSVDYFTQEELSALTEQMRKLGTYQIQERIKFRADELLKNGNLRAAISEYDKITAIRQSDKLGVDFYAKVYNNLGVCYARLFLFVQAAEHFYTSYEYKRDGGTLQSCLCALELGCTETEAEAFLKGKHITREMRLEAHEALIKTKKKTESSVGFQRITNCFTRLQNGDKEAAEELALLTTRLQRDYRKNQLQQ